MRRSHLFSGLLSIVAAACAQAAISVPDSSYTYTQNFDGLPSTAGVWADNSTLPGWFAYSGSSTTPTALNYATSAGGSGTGQMYSFGSSTSVNGAIDRALGSINQDATGDIRYGIAFVNDTGATITAISMSYEGEQWRVAASQVTTQTINPQYQFFPAGTGSISPAGFINFGIPFTSPKVNTSAGATFSLDGNLAENRASLSTTTSFEWLPGQELWIRFFDTNSAGNDHGSGIDSFSFAIVVPEPVAALGIVAILPLLHRRRTLG